MSDVYVILMYDSVKYSLGMKSCPPLEKGHSQEHAQQCHHQASRSTHIRS